MKYLLKVIGVVAMLFSMAQILRLSVAGYHENIVPIGAMTLLCLLGFALVMLSGAIRTRFSKQELSEQMCRHQRNYLINQMNRWDKELDEEELQELRDSGGQ